MKSLTLVLRIWFSSQTLTSVLKAQGAKPPRRQRLIDEATVLIKFTMKTVI